MDSVWQIEARGEVFTRATQISKACGKLIAEQQRLYTSGTSGRELIDTIDRLDFSKCVGSADSGDRTTIGFGFDQLRKNVTAHLLTLPFMSEGNEDESIGVLVIKQAFNDYMRDLCTANLPSNITFLLRAGRYSTVLRDLHSSVSHRFGRRSRSRSTSSRRNRNSSATRNVDHHDGGGDYDSGGHYYLDDRNASQRSRSRSRSRDMDRHRGIIMLFF